MEILIVKDGSSIDNNLLSLLPSKLILDNKINFVGIIFIKKKLIVSFPKKYNISKDINKDINIMYQIVQKYNKSFGYGININTDIFPLNEYISIYEYYKLNGLYSKTDNFINKGYGGKVIWKKTFNKSTKIISKDNLLFMPFCIKQKEEKIVFLSECMDYILFDGYDKFLKYINVTNGYIRQFNSDIFQNNKLVLFKLHNMLNNNFKDQTRKLIYLCIRYFEWKSRCGNCIKFYVKNSNLLWQKMVHEYLNQNFAGIDNMNNKTNKLLFNKKNKHIFEYEKSFKVRNKENKDITIRIDHYCYMENVVYLFDSKYYNVLNELNYKQIAYYYLLNKNYKLDTIFIGALFIPNNNFSMSKHIDRYLIDGLLIYEINLNVNEVVEIYIKKNI